MPSLSNKLLREKTMQEFLAAMGIDMEGVHITTAEGLFSFNFKDKKFVDQFASKLGTLLKANGANKAVSSISLFDIIDQNIEQSACNDGKLAIHRASCKAIFTIIKSVCTDFNYIDDTGEIEIILPSPGYVGLLESLQYPSLKLTKDGKVVINLKDYLKTLPEGVVQIEGLSSSPLPLVFVNETTLQSKGIFYATKLLPDLSTEITPYFFVPETTTPPNYHFVLDISGSMDRVDDNSGLTALNQLKTSIKKLSEQLFQLQSKATVSIITFSDGIHFLGKYSRENLMAMNAVIDKLQTRSNTPLHQVTSKLLEDIVSSTDHNNVLLFTDGEESGSSLGSGDRVNNLILQLQNKLLTIARNKFYVFNYSAQPDSLVSQVVDTFKSKTVYALSADFMAAQADPQLLKEWAASRDLFTTRVIVEDKAGNNSNDAPKHTILERSGQFSALSARVCKPGDRVNISIADGDNVTVAQSTITVPSMSLSYAGLMRFFEIPVSASPTIPVSKNMDPENLKLTVDNLSLINSYLI